MFNRRFSDYNGTMRSNLSIAIGIGLWMGLFFGDAVERVTLVRIPGVTNVIKAATDAKGAVHVVYDTEKGPFYTTATRAGAPFGRSIPVLAGEPERAGLVYHAWDMVVSTDGAVHVAMGNNAWKLKLPQEQWGFYLATRPPGAERFGAVRNINRKPSEGFALASGPGGVVAATFLSGKLYAMNSRDNGREFGAYEEVNASWNPCDCCTTSATFGPDGRLAVLYREETDNRRDMHLGLVDLTGRRKPTRVRVSEEGWSFPSCPMTYFSVTATSRGYVAAWPTKGRIYMARLNAEGELLAPGEIRTPGLNGMRTGVLALGADDGSVLVAWKNKEQLGWQLYGGAGVPEGQPGMEPSVGAGAAGVVIADGRFLLFP